jgi:hypothetical protein
MTFKKAVLVATLCITAPLAAYLPTNLTQPHDFAPSEHEWLGRYVQLGTFGEYMVDQKSFDPDKNQVLPTQIFGAKQSALAMLEGQAADSTLHQLSNRVRAMQDGTRGMFEVTGDFEAYTFGVGLEAHLSGLRLPGSFSVAVKVPFQYQAFKNVQWKSLTKQETLADDAVTSLIASDHDTLSSFVKTHGSLDIGGHDRWGLGDSTVMLQWRKRFVQQQRRLRSVVVNARMGVKIPTGYDRNINRAFDVCFGHDNTWGMPVGLGLQLDLSGSFRVGIDVGALLLSRSTRTWRLKSSWMQTDQLLLRTGKATREYGPEWNFDVYGQLVGPVRGLVWTLGYQFIKHTDSTLYPQDTTFSDAVINTAQNVEVSEAHSLVVDMTYNPRRVRNWRLLPELSIYSKIPVVGTRMINGYLVGGRLSWRF